VAVVIVEILSIKVDGSHLNLIRDHDGHPSRDDRRRAASRFGLRPTRLAATKDLHHFLGHQHPVVFMSLQASFPRPRHPWLVSFALEGSACDQVSLVLVGLARTGTPTPAPHLEPCARCGAVAPPQRCGQRLPRPRPTWPPLPPRGH